MIKVSNTDAAAAAAVEFSFRTNACVRAALDEAGRFDYCACAGCYEAAAAEAAGEAWAEGAWLRAAESVGYPCYCGRGQGGICC